MKSQIAQTVTIAQAKQTLDQTVELYFSKDSQGRYRMDRHRARPVCLMGPTGIGKTEIVRQVAQERGLAFLSYSVTHHTRQSAIGLPRLTERQMADKRVCVTEYTVSEIVAEVWRVMEESGKQEGILFLDEFNCASETLRPAMLQLLQSKSFGPHAIPEGWMLVLAGNPSEYNASASALDPVMADRMRLLWLEADYSVWREYMEVRQAHPIVLSYLDDHKNHFYVYEKESNGTGLVTARGWEDLSLMLRMMEEKSFPIDLAFVAQFLQSTRVSRGFYTYYQQYYDLIHSGVVEDILSGAASPDAVGAVENMTFAQRWALTCVVLLRLENLCADEAENASQAIEAALTFYDLYQNGQPQHEFLLNGITNSDPCARHIARHGSQAYRSAAERMLFQNDTPSVQRLKKLLEKAS